jgi:pimeloyl-ACP methyl ester carboxylesterase
VLAPLIERHAGSRTCIGLDLPGYGDSEPMEIERPSIEGFADWLEKTLDAFGFDRVDLYGQNTGSMISVHFANTRPRRVRSLVLENLPVFTPEERAEYQERFTPSLAPEEGGAHLTRAWNIREQSSMFWPWYRPEEANRIGQKPPAPEALAPEVMDLLKAGAGYWKGYQAVFAFDGAAAIAKLAVPAIVVSGTYAPLRGHLTRITNPPLSLKIATPSDRATNDTLIEEFLAENRG